MSKSNLMDARDPSPLTIALLDRLAEGADSAEIADAINAVWMKIEGVWFPILGQHGVDGFRVGVEVKHPPASADGARQVALVGERDLTRDVVACRFERDDRMTVREADRPAVGAGAPFLHSRNGGRRQVAEKVVRAERLPEWQPAVPASAPDPG